MKKELLRYSAALMVLILFGLFVYPTLYKYDKLEQKYPVKINRITGHTEMLTPSGWIELSEYKETPKTSPYPSATPAPTEPDKDQNGYTFDEYFEKIKENTKYPEKLNRDHEFFDWRRKVLGMKDYSLYPDDNGERFKSGDSQQRVKEVMGTPDSVSKNEFLNQEVWFYDESSITFKKGKVNEWNNTSDNLRIE